MFSFSYFSCFSSTKAVIKNDISNIEQIIPPIIQKDEPIIDVSNVPIVPTRTIPYYFKILNEKDVQELANSRLEDSKSEYIAADSDEDEDEDEDEICVILQDKPKEYSQSTQFTPIKDDSQEPIKNLLPNLDVQ